MKNSSALHNKRILIVDDERDILETLEDILSDCSVDSASNFESAKDLLMENQYDVAILDIMGVRGYDLLELTTEKGIPALMLTAHALSPDSMVKSVRNGARAFVPKEKIIDIEIFVRDILIEEESGFKKAGGMVCKVKTLFLSKIRLRLAG